MNNTPRNVIQFPSPEPSTQDPRDGGPVDSDMAVYTVKEVAWLLRLSLGGTYALVRDGTIPARRMGTRWVIPKRRFHAWLDSRPEATDEDFERDARRRDREGWR